MSIKKEWERYGADEPYYAILTDKKFRKENLDQSVLDDFFSSGKEYVERIWRDMEASLMSDLRPRRGLDFGCGVGRLTLPLAAKCDSILGIDISENMVIKARQNAARNNINNVTFTQDAGSLENVEGTFDFIHSFIVFQHIETKLGESIARRLIERLEPGGFGVLHFTYRDKTSLAAQTRRKIYLNVPLARHLRNMILEGKKEPAETVFSINPYNLNRLFAILQENDCHRCSVRFSDHGFDGVVLFFQKTKEIFY
jgi:2-polyprenyl-3-methyl-5-hydroxy-6-metoxy-1,4-benzoquinol methylase